MKSVSNVAYNGFLISFADYMNSDSCVDRAYINSNVQAEY